jgi:hypothetical protein
LEPVERMRFGTLLEPPSKLRSKPTTQGLSIIYSCGFSPFSNLKN